MLFRDFRGKRNFEILQQCGVVKYLKLINFMIHDHALKTADVLITVICFDESWLASSENLRKKDFVILSEMKVTSHNTLSLSLH